jgi:hypothetical protein
MPGAYVADSEKKGKAPIHNHGLEPEVFKLQTARAKSSRRREDGDACDFGSAGKAEQAGEPLQQILVMASRCSM